MVFAQKFQLADPRLQQVFWMLRRVWALGLQVEVPALIFYLAYTRRAIDGNIGLPFYLNLPSYLPTSVYFISRLAYARWEKGPARRKLRKHFSVQGVGSSANAEVSEHTRLDCVETPELARSSPTLTLLRISSIRPIIYGTYKVHSVITRVEKTTASAPILVVALI